MPGVSRETQIERYLSLLEKWGAALNLTSARDRTRLRAHLDQCLDLVPHLPPGTDRLTDLGSGQGFPAIPLGIATGLPLDLVEADRRKAAFLQTVLAQLALSGTVHPVRFDVARVAPAPCVTARALAPLQRLIPLALPFAQPDGTLLLMKGAEIDAELAALPSALVARTTVITLGAAPSCLVKFQNLR